MEYAVKQGVPVYEVYQPHYNLIERREFETTYAPLSSKYNLPVLPYYSLASGSLTGKYRSVDDLGKSPRWWRESISQRKRFRYSVSFRRGIRQTRFPTSYDCTCMATSQPHVTAPIVSATSKQQLAVLTDAPNIVWIAATLKYSIRPVPINKNVEVIPA